MKRSVRLIIQLFLDNIYLACLLSFKITKTQNRCAVTMDLYYYHTNRTHDAENSVIANVYLIGSSEQCIHGVLPQLIQTWFKGHLLIR